MTGCASGTQASGAMGAAAPWSAALLAAAVLGCCLRPAPGQRTTFALHRQPDPAAAGDTVDFNLQPPPGNFVLCVWYRALDTVQSSEIFSYLPSPDGSGNATQIDGPAATGRESGGPGCSLRIRDLRATDAGPYTVQLRSPSSITATTNLTVYELLPQPSVTPRNVTVTENGSFALSCERPAGTETLLWLRDGAPLVAGGRLALSEGNRTLTAAAAARADTGAYACEAQNPVSSNRSEAAAVTVTYGPDAATVSPPSPVRAPLGSHVELACTADAVPPPRYAWTFGNTTLGRESRLAFIFGAAAQAGEYRCVATNPVLHRAAAATALLLQPPQPEHPSTNGCPGTEEEIKYSTLAFGAGAAPGAAARAPPRDGTTIYCEVKRT
ncbi:carcinoembryonic antigen-related cell adhesion molecule 6-like isoform X2 [Apteryx mantelli]|uniref:Carcinoembryonic antigen-related cell adhesion molecule 6-like isoform X2 n=1 Tax=Apteryx mantelli TaxID=2696672 RepID=A0ABM4G6Y1_9AVES